MSKRTAYGIVLNRGEMPPGMHADAFSNSRYEGVSLWKTRNSKPAVILMARKAPKFWKVVHGTGAVFFKEYDEAVDYCAKHGFSEIQKG